MACHKCDTPWCVNPEHIFIGTAKDNSLDAHAKGRFPSLKGTHRKNTKARYIDDLRLSIRIMKRHQPLYRALKQELTRLGYWKEKPRGKPFGSK